MPYLRYPNISVYILNDQSTKSNTIGCLIIDDDPFIQDLLMDKLQQYFPEIKVLGKAMDGKQGLAKIASLDPDLVFLDVEMSDMTGFEMLSQLNTIGFKIIFITSYKHYAIKAIRFNALDYLLKPFDLEELKNAVKRYKETESPSTNLVLHNLKAQNAKDQTMILRTQQGELYIPLKDIVSIQGERNYSYINLVKDKKELVSKTLRSLEDLLEEKGFFRCHKSFIVSKNHIVSVRRSSIILSDMTEIPISRRKQDQFKKWQEE